MRWVALLGAAVLVRAQCPCCVPLSIEAEEACGNIDNAVGGLACDEWKQEVKSTCEDDGYGGCQENCTTARSSLPEGASVYV